ncbi:ABC transporter permease [Gordoniibacillus kamchatkensis]|nr:ABC transporter permease [Paenibacillus sp. VKM B-2647]
MEKLWKRRRTKGSLLLTLLVPAAAAMLLSALQTNAGVLGSLGSSLPLMMLSLFTFAPLPVVLFMAAADSFSGEAAARTIKLVLVRPIARTKVFASKVLAIAVYVAVLLAALWIASVISGLFVPKANVAGSLLESAIAYTAAFVPMMAVGLMAVFVAQCFSNTTGAMTLSLLIYAAAKLLPFVLPQVSVWSVFSYTDWHVLWIGNAVSAVKLLSSFFLLLAYCIMAYTAGWIVFDRKQW